MDANCFTVAKCRAAAIPCVQFGQRPSSKLNGPHVQMDRGQRANLGDGTLKNTLKYIAFQDTDLSGTRRWLGGQGLQCSHERCFRRAGHSIEGLGLGVQGVWFWDALMNTASGKKAT